MKISRQKAVAICRKYNLERPVNCNDSILLPYGVKLAKASDGSYIVYGYAHDGSDMRSFCLDNNIKVM